MALILCLLAAIPALGAPKVLSIEVQNDSIVEKEELLRLFKPAKGEEYRPEEARRSIGLLSLLPGVLTVEVQTKEEEQGVRVRLLVKPEPLVRSIGVSGVHFLSSSDVESKLLTHPDDPAFREKIEEDLAEILRRYGEEGYEKATGKVLFEEDDSGHWQDVVIKIDEGKPRIIDDYGSLGDAAVIGLDRFFKELDLKKGSIASRQKLRAGVSKVQKYCFANGYPEARIRDWDFKSQGDRTLLYAPLDLGTRTNVLIEGVPSTEVEDLLATASQEYGGQLDQDRLTRISTVLRDSLFSQGYLSSTVEYNDAVVEGVRTVTFRIKRSTRAKIDKIEFTGNQVVSSDDLFDAIESGKNLILTEYYNPETIDGDLGRIRQLYITKGFLDAVAKIKNIDVSPNGDTTLLIEVTEGRKYLFGKISYRTDGCFSPEYAADTAQLKPATAAYPGELEAARVRLLNELSKLGYSRGEVARQTSIDTEKATVNVVFEIKGGKKIKVGSIVVTGNARTMPNVLLRELTFKEGDPWSQQEIIDSRQNIFRLGFFEQVEFRPVGLMREDGSQDLEIHVRELDAGYLDYGLGYGTDEGFNTFAELGHTNIFGAGRSASARFEYTKLDRVFSANYVEPWIFDFPVDLKIGVVLKEQELPAYDLDSVALQTSVDYDFSTKLKASLIHTLEYDKIINIRDPSVVGDRNFIASTLSPVLVYDSRDDQFNPRKGYLHSAQYEWASKLIGSELEYSKITVSLSGYYSLWRMTLALLARGGAAEYYGRDELLPLNKRFFLGGRSTVRGFAKDEIGPKSDDGISQGGDLMLNLKAELRTDIYKGFGLAFFWDAGQVWLQEQSNAKLSDLRQAAGPGIRYNTPVGPIAVDVGYKLDRKPGESAYEWHFTIGNVF